MQFLWAFRSNPWRAHQRQREISKANSQAGNCRAAITWKRKEPVTYRFAPSRKKRYPVFHNAKSSNGKT
jgi:hypothetical protein